MKFLVINGPNLNMMHFTEPGVAGQLDYNGLLDYLELCCTQMGMEVEFFQSNHEGDLIDEIQSAEPDEHEPFRKTDIVSFGCQGHFIGEGISGYLHAAAYLAQLLRLDGSAHTHLVM